MNAISHTASLQQAPEPGIPEAGIPEPATPEPATSDIDVLQRLIELGIKLAELAFRQAHQEAAPQPEEQAAKAPLRPGRADPQVIFLRLRRAIQETISFKNRLAAAMMIETTYARRHAMPRPTPERAPERAPERTSAPSAKPQEDPRRPHIARYFREAIDITEKKRKIPLTRQDVDNCIDAELAKDPEHRIQGRSVLLKVCKSLDLPFYANRMSTELFRPAPASLATP